MSTIDALVIALCFAFLWVWGFVSTHSWAINRITRRLDKLEGRR